MGEGLSHGEGHRPFEIQYVAVLEAGLQQLPGGLFIGAGNNHRWLNQPLRGRHLGEKDGHFANVGAGLEARFGLEEYLVTARIVWHEVPRFQGL